MTTESVRKPLGLVGLGLLGSALAEKWLADGFNVVGYDRDGARRLEHSVRGGEVADSATAVGQVCRRIVLCLPERTDSNAVCDKLSPGRVLIDTTTGDANSARALATRLAKQGSRYIEATISGSSEQVRQGNALVITGGDPVAIADCEDLWPSVATKVINVGAVGNSATVKLVTNLVLGLNRAALAEGLALAASQGLELAGTLSVLLESFAYSRIMDTKGPKMIAGDFSPQARLSQHAKDVRLILAAAADEKLELPLTVAHQQLLHASIAQGLGELDNSAIIRVYQPTA